MILKLLCLPFYFIALGACLLLPVLIVVTILRGEPGAGFMALGLLGILPLFLAYLHAARIEHFVVRRLVGTARAAHVAGDFILAPSQGFRCLMAHHRLHELLSSQQSLVDEATYDKGTALARRHRVLSRLSLLGLPIMVIGFVCFEYL